MQHPFRGKLKCQQLDATVPLLIAPVLESQLLAAPLSAAHARNLSLSPTCRIFFLSAN